MITLPAGIRTTGAFLTLALFISCVDSFEGTELHEQEIRGGTEVIGHPGMVMIQGAAGSCSGWILNERVIVTAAHCLPSPSGTGSFTVYYFRPGIGKEKIFSGSLRYAQDPNFDGTWQCGPSLCGFTLHDIAFLENISGTWSDTDHRDYLRVYQDYGNRISTVRVWGAGFNTYSGNGFGVLRNHVFAVNGDPYYNVLETEGDSTYNVCEGDSGGPAAKEVNGMEFVAGVLSLMVVPLWGDDKCSSDGGSQWYTRTNWEHLSWIASETNSHCSALTAHDFSYKRCFSIPFINHIAEEGYERNVAVAIASVIL
jgi:hypothetical protein